jgi:hypothetical protein
MFGLYNKAHFEQINLFYYLKDGEETNFEIITNEEAKNDIDLLNDNNNSDTEDEYDDERDILKLSEQMRKLTLQRKIKINPFSIHCGRNFTYILSKQGTYSFGENNYGQLGLSSLYSPEARAQEYDHTQWLQKVEINYEPKLPWNENDDLLVASKEPIFDEDLEEEELF